MPTNLVIVESPTKAKTIKKFLGKDFIVESSMGHIRDLPKRDLGVDTEGKFTPTYVIPKEKATTVKNLKKLYKESDELWIATDEDREGEAIGWHLLAALGVKDSEKTKRIVFHEITESAILEAIRSPRTIDRKLVDAQQARRILDRLVGYTLSPFLWKKVYRGLSAGRVQSTAVRLIVDREREIKAFTPEEYWTILSKLAKKDGTIFEANFTEKAGEKFVPNNENDAKSIVEATNNQPFIVRDIEVKELTKNPAPPFTTSTLQQEAARKLGFSVKQTMVVAQQLYEGINLGKGKGSSGLITYMRTDSVNLSEKAITDAKTVIGELYGREYTLSTPRTYKTKSKGAQEAHEAIRPTEMSRSPNSLADVLDEQQMKLYTLIWNRTISTQMASAELKRVGANIIVDGSDSVSYTFRATGQTILFDGFLRVYMEGRDEDQAGDDDGEKFLPALLEGEQLACESVSPLQHFTKPPARYTEASLVRKLEEEGIGRPSTYAPTISTIQQRGYIRKEGKQLLPEDVAFTVTDLLAEHFPNIVDLKFTAQMEERLDDIAEGKEKLEPFLRGFFEPFSALVEQKQKEIKKEDIMQERILGEDFTTGLPIIVRNGRYGAYVQIGKFDPKKAKEEKPKAASLFPGMSIDTVTLEDARKLLSFPLTLGNFEGNPVLLSLGRFGPYLMSGDFRASIPKGTHPFDVDITKATELLTLAKEKGIGVSGRLLGKDPVSGGDVSVKDGRFGPYITDGTTNASLRKGFDPATITLAEAAEILVKKRAAPKRPWKGRWKKKEA